MLIIEEPDWRLSTDLLWGEKDEGKEEGKKAQPLAGFEPMIFHIIALKACALPHMTPANAVTVIFEPCCSGRPLRRARSDSSCPEVTLSKATTIGQFDSWFTRWAVVLEDRPPSATRWSATSSSTTSTSTSTRTNSMFRPRVSHVLLSR